MKNLFKKSLSVILSLFLLLGVLSVAGTAAEKHDPLIVVTGMGCFPLYIVDESGNRVQVWGPNSEMIKNTIVSVLKKSVTAGGFVSGLIDGLYEELFSIVACNEDGTSKNNIVVPFFEKSVDNYPDDFENSENTEDEVGIVKTLIKQYGGENVYFFNYDWRMSPLDDADGLNDFINNVKNETGSPTVTLIPCSMGGTVANAYLNKYGSASVSKIIYSMVASKGLDMVGELFNKNITVNIDTVMEYFFSFEMSNVLVQLLISSAQAGLNYTKLGVGLDVIIAKLLNKLNDRAYNELLSKTFANFPGIWSFVGEEYYESGKKTMFVDGGNATFISLIDDYHYNVMNRAEELMTSAQNAGKDIYIIASYGYVGAPVTKYATEQTDCLIETKNESFGATCAPYGKTLGDDYTALGTVCDDASHNHVSTDGIIDASTGAFPEVTWFIKNNRHVGLSSESDCAGFVVFLTETDGATVHSDQNYPQFIELNPISGKFTSLTGDEIEQTSTLRHAFSRLITVFKALIETIKKHLGL